MTTLGEQIFSLVQNLIDNREIEFLSDLLDGEQTTANARCDRLASQWKIMTVPQYSTILLYPQSWVDEVGQEEVDRELATFSYPICKLLSVAPEVITENAEFFLEQDVLSDEADESDDEDTARLKMEQAEWLESTFGNPEVLHVPAGVSIAVRIIVRSALETIDELIETHPHLEWDDFGIDDSVMNQVIQNQVREDEPGF